MNAALKDIPQGWQVIEGKFVFELRPREATKGTAIEAFMGEAPFIGRTPMFCGDDITDEDGFAVVNARGGVSIRVGKGSATRGSGAGRYCRGIAGLAGAGGRRRPAYASESRVTNRSYQASTLFDRRTCIDLRQRSLRSSNGIVSATWMVLATPSTS